MDRYRIANCTAAPGFLQVGWGDGHQSVFHYVWLWDNDPENRHASGQKLTDVDQIPPGISPASVQAGDTLRIVWAQDGKISEYSPAWLRQNAYEPEEVMARQQLPRLWDAKTLEGNLPEFRFEAVSSNPAELKGLLHAVRTLGFAILHGAPTEEESIFKVVDLFGFVRETNYGRLFDVKVTPNPTNLAFTGLTLKGHTDNPYRHPVPTLQLLHFLKNSAEGGDSTLVDGFRVAETFRRESPVLFNLLATVPVTFRFSSMDAELDYETTIIEHDARGRISGIRYNNRSIQPFYTPPDQMESFYDAYRSFGEMLEDPKFKITFKLDPGGLMIFDNQRILHGRIGYQAGGERHLQGCYADKDSLYSRLALLERTE